MAQHEFLTVEEIAAQLRVHKITVHRHIRSGKLRANLIGGQYRISREDYEAYLGETKTKKVA